jgi:Ca2+-binding EF-hand superfamily protein
MASLRKNTRSKLSSERKKKPLQRRHYLLCVKNDGYPTSLEVRKIYKPLPDSEANKHRLIRVIDESGEDYLYPRDFFIPIALPKAAEIALAAPAES